MKDPPGFLQAVGNSLDSLGFDLHDGVTHISLWTYDEALPVGTGFFVPLTFLKFVSM